MNTLYIPLESLESYAENTGRSLPITGSTPGKAVEQTVRRALKTLLARREELQRNTAQTDLPDGGRWLLDNGYLAQREGLDCCEAFHRCGRLPSAEGEPLILALARALLASGGGSADEERAQVFLAGFQKKTILTRRELGLFPAALRAAAVLRLAALYEKDIPSGEAAGAVFQALRLWSTLDMTPMLDRADHTEQILRQDPAGIYPQMDESSRAAYRRQVELLARRRGIPEHRAAGRVVRLAREGGDDRTRHVGYYLFHRPLGDRPGRRRGLWYIGLNILLPVSLCAAIAWALGHWWAGLLLWLPVWQVVKTTMDSLLIRFGVPGHLPRLALEEGVPPEGRTICVVSTLLTDEESAKAATRRLEEFAHASRSCGSNLLFGLLCDLPEAEQAKTQADRLLLEKATAGVEELNRRYGGGFYLLCRDRSWSRDTGRFAGWERKRGALLELCRLLKGEKSTLEVLAGNRKKLRGTRYVITLDADTRLPPDSARELIGAAMHPLNCPVIDGKKRMVVAGHGVIQPRIATDLAASQATFFTRLFAPQGGSDPYSGDTGELYMDRFDSGGFAGKGILDVSAMLSCMDNRLPENRVLSHDALEGAFLRGGRLGDTELTDGFPATPASYYKRLHRWVRGDWQNAPWLFRPGRGLPPMEKWRLFDSLRRSLTPGWSVTAIVPGLILPGAVMGWIAGIGLLCFFHPLLQTLLFTLTRREADARLRLFSGLYHGLSAAMMESLLRLVLLPWEAWVCTSAAATALWRMLISHRNLLVWQTAAQSEAGGNRSFSQLGQRMWFALVLGAVCLVTATTIPGRTLGLMWLLSPAAAVTLARGQETPKSLSPGDRDWLKSEARLIWGYFRQFCTAEDNWLPPDNFQDSPPVGLAHRTSPTNMGLGLIAALCAMDLGLGPREEALTLIDRMLTTMEALPKWKGHFYNWYDTRTTKPLEPRYISTVDSGNLAACLLTLGNGLTEYNITKTAKRAEALRSAMDFRPLYDEKRHLFRIGLEPGNLTPAKSWYDLLESEERLTGYLAIARGQVPRRHWRRLSRAQVGCDGFRGMASWTGTMFEYLMPELFLPLHQGSLLYESARFALYVQRKGALGRQRVWGRSESAFYALDPALNYRYKAHGCADLALCRGMDEEAVLSPYSSFLALAVSPRRALENLRALETMGMTGPYGFWEAIDFTPSRCGDKGCIVRCVMAHHLGMSLAAIANALLDNVLPRRFMADPAMAAYAGLLQERIPMGGLLLRRREAAPPPRRGLAGGNPRERTGADIDYINPSMVPLSNGVYSLHLSESGVSKSLCAALLPYRSPGEPLGDGQGLELYLREGNEVISLLPHPGQREVDFSWRFTPGEAVHTGQRPHCRWTVTSRVSRQEAGELRRVVLHRDTPDTAGELLLMLEPVLAAERDYRSSPSFTRLGMEMLQRPGALLIHRLPRGGQGDLYMALSCNRPAVYSADGRELSHRRGLPPEPVVGEGWQSEPLVAVQVSLNKDETDSDVLFALCMASTEQEALAGAQRMLRDPEGFAMAEAAARALHLSDDSAEAAMDMLPGVLFPRVCAQGEDEPGLLRESLWELGISGDLPLVGVECTSPEGVVTAVEHIKRHGLLAACGVVYDLVFLTDDNGEYLRPRRTALESTLTQLGRVNLLGAKGGIHFAPDSHRGLLQRAAALWFDGNTPAPEPRHTKAPLPLWALPRKSGEEPVYGWGSDGSFAARHKGTLPPRSWGNILTNGCLSAFAADTGTGSLWYENARECPLFPWSGDPLGTDGPERLWVELEDQTVSFFARPGEDNCAVRFAPGIAMWEKTMQGLSLRLTAFIPPHGDVRLYWLESSAPCTVGWCTPIQMAPEAEDTGACSATVTEGMFTGENPRCPHRELRLYAGCSEPWLETATDTRRFLAGEPHSPRRSGAPGFAGRFHMEREAVLACGTEDVRPWLTPEVARRALAECRDWWSRAVGSLTAETPDKELNRLLGGWAAYQALACRCMARSSPYQSGGAMGFRDQLQDRVNLIPLDAPGCREHILRSCAHQFREGDVQHWWHPTPGGGGDKGVRTRCSDDLLWLPWALCEYVEQTGDESLCRDTAPWLTAPPLNPGEDSRYETPQSTEETSTVLAHCRRALELVLVRGVGQHGLLFMGSGDWNDGFDAMGEGAESVWLSWFFSITAHKFARLLHRLGEPDHEKYRRAAEALGRSADRAWDGDRYLRGYYGDGTPLGQQGDSACAIDSIAQSFAALCPYASEERVEIALDTALRELWNREEDMARLYAPAFTGRERAPGYVAGYGPGFRENGGQYTHAALWLAMACFRRGRAEEGAGLLRCASAAGRDVTRYGAEPFVIPADIYAGDQQGRAGWSWYTGSAGWFFTVAFRELLGFRLRDGQVELNPCLPPDWPGYTGRWVDSEGNEHRFGMRDGGVFLT